MTQEKVEFYSEGSLIKGILHLPQGIEEKSSLPGVVLCHGFAGVKELLLPNFARAFSEAGLAALTFDYRGFGESQGEPGRLVPQDQITDIRNAVTYMQSLSQVAPGKVGLWGTSFGGANAIVAAARDNRVKCLAVQLTFGNGERVITGNLSAEEKEKLTAMMMKLWTKAVTQNKIMQVPVQRVLTDEQSIEFFNKTIEKFPELNVKIPFLTIKETMDHKPEEVISSLNIPISIIGAENDKVNPKEESEILYGKANSPKELHMVAGATHYELYEGEKFKETVNRQIAWFQKYLV